MSDTIVHVFTTLKVADLIDDLAAAIDLVRSSTARDNRPWMVALDKAWDYILQADTLHYDLAAHAIRVESVSKPGRFFESNGTCQCAAQWGAGICWHRACARLVRRAIEHGAARELASLAAELEDEALADGCDWYTASIATLGASARMDELRSFAATWDAVSAAQRTALAA